MKEILEFLQEPKTIIEIQERFGKKQMEKILRSMKSFIITGKVIGTKDGRYVSCL